LNRERKGRKRKQRDVEFAGLQRRDHRRRALETNQVDVVTLALVLQDRRDLVQDRRRIPDRHHPGDADLDRLLSVRGRRTEPRECRHREQ
jgi:hypothetical protein